MHKRAQRERYTYYVVRKNTYNARKKNNSPSGIVQISNTGLEHNCTGKRHNSMPSKKLLKS